MASALHLAPGCQPYPGYELTQFLGRGGWGEVWKAQRQDGAVRALKFLPSDSQLTAAAQEVRALQAIRQLDHPHLLKPEQIWSCPGYLVLVMELADGNLLDLLEVYLAEFGGPITAEHLCFFLSQAAKALDFLNARQHKMDGQRVAFRHCDVKPSNLLVLGQKVKLADFSLAVQTTGPIWHHRRVGTLNYAAPEIFHGWLSDRTDQYALAITYVQLRTGALPFEPPPGFNPDYVRPAPDLSRLTPAEVAIIKRGLAPVPQDRWPTCGEMLRHLSEAARAACQVAG
ncbi:MAG: serine/threonine-protein kinase [Gemmataceae bacterium]